MTERAAQARHHRVLYVAWGAVAGRSQELARALDGNSLTCFPPSARWRPRLPIRYTLATIRTMFELLRRRPNAVIVTNPPVIPGLLALAYGRLRGAPVVLDDHPGSFGAQGDRQNGRLVPVHRRMVPFARLCLVTDQAWVEVVESWRGRAMLLHESPGTWQFRPSSPSATPRVLFVGTFSRDEPVAEVVEAAALLGDVELLVTGDLDRRPAALAEVAPPNLRWLGLLPFVEYQRSVYAADVVIALTTEPTSAMRAAFETVWSGTPLVVSRWPLSEELFPHAHHCANDGPAIAGAVRSALASSSDRNRLEEAERLQQLRWTAQLAELRGALSLPPSSSPDV